MNILIVGGGGREHAIAKKISESERFKEAGGKLYAAPGNGGIASLAECLPVSATDIDGMVAAAKEIKADLVFVAPDDPLMLGMVDKMEEAGIRAFGPHANAAIIEGSKVFSKHMMKKYNIPTAAYEVFDSSDAACKYIEEKNEYPVVVKAEGLALGKGVIIAEDYESACEAVRSMIDDGAFGASGSRVVIEQFLTGTEITVLAFTDGEHVLPMVSSQDHKRAFDNDKGPNTGGMGAISPSPVYDDALADRCMKEIFIPTIQALKAEGRIFKGVVYFGLMLTAKGPYVIEYNARFGDPETQVVLPRLECDILDIIDAVIDGGLDQVKMGYAKQAAACVVIASGGYPASYKKGFPITGIDEANKLPDVFVYHAGTKLENGEIVTNGGRVLGVTALGDDMPDALKKAYEAAARIHFEGMFMRSDIGASALKK